MQSFPREILLCHTDDDRIPFSEWLFGLLDAKTRSRIEARLERLEDGNLGDMRGVGEGVFELRLDFGPGYRIYFGQNGNEIHLLGGGSKATQSQDIVAAKAFWRRHGD